MIALGKFQGTYSKDILDQPQALRDTVAALVPPAELEAVRQDLRTRRLHRVVLDRHGGSYQTSIRSTFT